MPSLPTGDMTSKFIDYYNDMNNAAVGPVGTTGDRNLIAQSTPVANPFDPAIHTIGTFVDHTGQLVIYYYEESSFANSPLGQGLGSIGGAIQNFWNTHHWPHVVVNDAMLAGPGEEGMVFEGANFGEGPAGVHSYGIPEGEVTGHWAEELGISEGEPQETFPGYESDNESVDSTAAVSSPINYIVENNAQKGEIAQALRDAGYTDHAIEWIMSDTNNATAFISDGEVYVFGVDAQGNQIQVITADEAIQLGANRADVNSAHESGAIFIKDANGEVVAFRDNKMSNQGYYNYVSGSNQPPAATLWNKPGSTFQVINIHTNPYS
jgi:hypothetical protein